MKGLHGISLFVLLAVLCMTLFACADGESVSGEEDASARNETPAPPEEAASEEAVDEESVSVEDEIKNLISGIKDGSVPVAKTELDPITVGESTGSSRMNIGFDEAGVSDEIGEGDRRRTADEGTEYLCLTLTISGINSLESVESSSFKAYVDGSFWSGSSSVSSKLIAGDNTSSCLTVRSYQVKKSWQEFKLVYDAPDYYQYTFVVKSSDIKG